MASQLVAAGPASSPVRLSPWRRLIQVLVNRRVAISALLFVSLVLLDLFVFHNHPRDIFNLTSVPVVVAEMLILAGLAIRAWAAGTLRKQKTLAISGPYAWVRHPLYVGSFLMMVGFCTLVRDPLTIWFVIGPIAWLYWQAVRSEEQKMQKLFPNQWPLYAQSVPRFIPRRLLLPHAADWSIAQWLSNSEYQALLGSAAALIGLKLWQLCL